MASHALRDLKRPLTEIVSEPPAHEPKVAINEIPSVHSINSKGIEFIVEGLIAAGTVNGLTGEAGCGKTTLTTALAGSVSCGVDFLGHRCEKRPVLILDRENTLPIVQERLSRLGIQDGSNLKIWGSWLAEDAPMPGGACVKAWVQATDPKPLIIVDSLIAFLDGDENDARVVRAFMQQFRDLANLGATVIFLHHSGKGESSRAYRGSSDIKASIDVGYLLTNLGEGQLDRLRLKAFKTRFTVITDLILHYLDGQFTADDRPEAVAQTVTQQLTALLRGNPGVTTRKFQQLAVTAGLGERRAFDFLKDGVEAGCVRRERGLRNSIAHYLNEDFHE
jgi:hypothetical protein